MSSDNFWFVKGRRVYMGNASDYQYLSEEAQKDVDFEFKERLLNNRPSHIAETAEEARAWAYKEYAEYGVYWVDDDDDPPAVVRSES